MVAPHTCQALVITCIDFRFVSPIRDYLDSLGLKDNYDLVTVPGASLEVGKIAETLETSLRLHDPGQILIFDHQDCGAYQKNNSKNSHITKLNQAKEYLLDKFPNRLIKLYLAGFKKIEEIN